MWIAIIILALDGRAPDWGPILLFLASSILLLSITEFTGTYADRDEDRLYAQSNPLVTGELDSNIAGRALILQNVLAAALLVILLLVSRDYYLIMAMLIGWFVGVAYSVSPFRFKETVIAPFWFGLGVAILAIVAWLSVESSLTAKDGFIIAFASFLFILNFGHGITQKLRKTFLALDSGMIKVEKGGSICNVRTIGLGLNVKTAIVLEAATALGAFVFVPIFWHLGIFNMPLSITLVTVPLGFTIIAVILRIKEPFANWARSMRFMILAWTFIVASLLGVALTTLLHWGFAILVCAAFLAGFVLLFRTVHPLGGKALTAPWS